MPLFSSGNLLNSAKTFHIDLARGYARTSSNRGVAVLGQVDNQHQRLPRYWRTDLTALWHLQSSLEAELAVLNLFDRGNRFPSITNVGGVDDVPFSLSVGLRYRWE